MRKMISIMFERLWWTEDNANATQRLERWADWGGRVGHTRAHARCETGSHLFRCTQHALDRAHTWAQIRAREVNQHWHTHRARARGGSHLVMEEAPYFTIIAPAG